MIRKRHPKRFKESRKLFAHRKKMNESITVTIELTPEEFQKQAWSGAIDTLDSLTANEIEQIFNNLADVYGETPSLADVNDFFWFERDTIAEWLGYTDWDELTEDR